VECTLLTLGEWEGGKGDQDGTEKKEGKNVEEGKEGNGGNLRKRGNGGKRGKRGKEVKPPHHSWCTCATPLVHPLVSLQ